MTTLLPDFRQYFRQAARGLRRAPGFTALCVLTLAVGIGADTAVWSLLDAVLLRPLPYPRADRLLWLGHTAPGLDLPEVGVSDGTYVLYRDHQKTLSGLALYRAGFVNLAGTGAAGDAGDTAPRRVPSATATASLFSVLGVQPRLGHSFTTADERPGGPAVVLLGDGLWRELGGDRHDRRLLGRTLRIDGVPTQVIGVLPPGFAFPEIDTALWLPRRLDPVRTSLALLNDDAVARLAPGVTRQAAAADLGRLAHDLARWWPGRVARVLAKGGFAPLLRPLRDQQVGAVGAVLWLLLGAVGCILAIACANVANLLLVRGEGRRRELAVHAALGAPRRALLSGVLAESLLLGLAAGALGVLLAGAGLQLLAALRPPSLAHLTPAELNGRTLVFAAGLALFTSLLFGLVPALRASRRIELAAALQGGGRAMTAGRGRQLLRQALVGLQMALAVMLLTGAALLLQSFRRLAAIDPGFDPKSTLTLELALPAADYPDDLAVAHGLDAMLARLAALPGVQVAGATSTLPLALSAVAGHMFEDFPSAADALPPMLGYQYVTPGYFRAMGIPILEGRGIESADAEERTGAAVVSAALAHHFWPHGSALGRRLRLQRGYHPGDPWFTIVGVAGNVRQRELTETAAEEMVYYPVLGMKPGAWAARQMTFAVRTRVAPESLVPEVRSEIHGVAPDLPVAHVRTLTEVLHEARSRFELAALLLLLATVIALTLGAVGLYGFVSYLVSLRTAEIGIRMALGADGRRIRRMILGEALTTTAFGLAVGLGAALGASRALGTLLFEVSPLDPVAFSVAPLLLVAAMLLASYLPSDRAARIEPRIALERLE
ncbi:MAG TPA: ABC transporter permease [Thermoanaerobaculia bacterium]|nr:ABC transporter permease [Thermoanaerobaculia bacterium]